MKKTISGFTIVELLIVIVVIAILAAISVVAYTGIQQRARTSAHAHAASQAEREIMTYALQQNSESISLSGTLVGYKEGAGEIQLLKPLTGTPDITMYGVYDVVSTSVAYTSIGHLTPSSAGNTFRLQANLAGNDSMGYRIDTSAQTSLGYSISGFRIPGNTVIGWLQARSDPLTRAFGYNQAAPHQSTTLTAHTGWNFTGALLDENASGAGRAILVFNAAHDQATRQQVISWLAQKYNVSL